MICQVAGCEKIVKGSGLCSGHLHRLKRYGSPTGTPPARAIASCSVSGCKREFYGRSYCVKHYLRWRKYGDPLGGGIDYRTAQEFMKSLTSTDAEECITWPFGKTKDGYGRINWKGVSQGAHVVATTFSNGPKPSAKHEACHRCGNGHLGCVNPKHLYWGTRKDNVQDAIRHGTSYSLRVPKGEKHHSAKYSDVTIRDALSDIRAGKGPTAIKLKYGISINYFYALKSGRFRAAQSSAPPLPPPPY